MGNENIKIDVQNLQKLMVNILEENKKMNEKIEKMGQNISNLNEENKMQNEEIRSQKQEIQLHKEKISELERKSEVQEQKLTDLKERFDYLKDECQDMKESLGNIQCRDLAKNFMRVFGTLLTNDDWSYIRKNKNEKGKIIAKRIKELYPQANKKKI